MAQRYRAARRGTRSSRRKLVWARGVNISPGETVRSYDLLANWRTAMDWGSTPGVTIRRIRMDVTAMGSDFSDYEAGFAPNLPVLGLIVWSQDTAPEDLPDPVDTEGRHSDWMSWGQYSPLAQGGNSAQFTVDVKSQRKLEEMRQTVWLVRDTVGQVGAENTTLFRINTSVLLALP